MASVTLLEVHHSRFHTALGIEFLQQALNVNLHRSLRDMQYRGYMFVGHPLGNFAQDLHFATRKAFELLMQVVSFVKVLEEGAQRLA